MSKNEIKDNIKSQNALNLIECSYFRSDFSKNYEDDTTLRRDYMAKTNAINAIIIAENEAEQRHQNQLQELRNMAVEAFKSACSCGIEAGIGRKCERFTDCARYKMFTQKLTEKQ